VLRHFFAKGSRKIGYAEKSSTRLGFKVPHVFRTIVIIVRSE